MKFTIEGLQMDIESFDILTSKLKEIGTELNTSIDVDIKVLNINLHNRIISVDELEKLELDKEYTYDLCTLETPEECCPPEDVLDDVIADDEDDD